MKIGRPVLSAQDNQIRYVVPVESSAGARSLWFSIDRAYADLLSDRADAALVALLIPAMKLGEEIIVEGTVSPRLLYHLDQVQLIRRIILPELHQVRIYADDVRAADTHGHGVAAGFSGGVDSFCLLADYHYGNPPTGYRLTHLLYNDVGAHGRYADVLYPAQLANTQQTAEHIGLPLVAVRSNLDTFYAGVTFLRSHPLRNASVALLLQNGLQRFLYASGFAYANVMGQQIAPPEDDGFFCLPLLCTETLNLNVVGSQYTRVEKIQRIAELPASYTTLDLCFNVRKTVLGGGSITTRNCSACGKCLRALLTMEIAGCLERYSAVFDLSIYRKKRDRYITELLSSPYYLDREVVNFARARGFAFPWYTKAAAAVRLPERYEWLRKTLRSVRLALRRLKR